MTVNSIHVALPAVPQRAAHSFGEVLTQAPAWDAEFHEMESAPVEHFDVEEQGLICVGNRLVPIDQSARDRIFIKAGAPASYLRNRSITIQMLAIQEHLRQGDFGSMTRPVLRNGQLFTFQRGDLRELSYSETLTAVADGLGENADRLTVSRIDRTDDGRLELELVSPAKSLEIRRDDVVMGGLHIVQPRYANEATQIYSFVYRLVCENGMMRRECVSSEGIVRTRKLPVGHPRAKELAMDQLRQLASRTYANLEPQLGELRATAERPANVKQLLTTWLQRARFSTRLARHSDGSNRRADVRRPEPLMARILNAWREAGAVETVWAAVNALTYIGTHDRELSPLQRRRLSLLGGVLAFSHQHLCPRCFSVLSGSAHEGSASRTGFEAV